MIDERAIELAIVERITAHAPVFTATYPGGEWFRQIENVGLYDIDLENIREVVRTDPACLVEYGGETAADMGTTATSSTITARVYVYVFVTGLISRGKTSQDANALARIIKDALRGWIFRTDGQTGHLKYRGATPRGRIDGTTLQIKALEFDLQIQDHPLT